MELESPGRAAGGLARAASLSVEQRSESAKKAAAARWSKGELQEVLAGSPDRLLKISEIEIECYVLADDTRVLTQGSMLEAMGRHRRVAGRDEVDESLPPILQGKAIRPYIPADVLEKAQPVSFRLPNNARASGYRAELLPAICEIYLAARADGKLPSNQLHIAQRAEVLVRGLATVGIIALVDEATGYQEVRTKDALSRILEAFVAKELQPWVKTFPPDFYREMFRLRKIDYNPMSVQRPRYFGTLTNDIVYDRLAPAVREELKKAQLKSEKSGKLFQHLTSDLGYPRLREHLGSVVTLMKLSRDWADFRAKIDLIHPSYKKNMPAPLWLDEGDFGL
jgi:hypothetical protein